MLPLDFIPLYHSSFQAGTEFTDFSVNESTFMKGLLREVRVWGLEVKHPETDNSQKPLPLGG